jgi:3-hydroxyphenylacetate 6-hydroxylase
LNKPAVASYAGHLDLETTSFIRNVLEAGDAGLKAIEPKPHIQRFALCMALTVNWGTRLASQDEKLFREIIEVEKGVVSLRDRTQNMIDYIPLLRLMPFSSKAKKAKDWRGRRDVYLAKFDRELRAQIDKGTQKPSIQANAMLDPENKLSKDELTSISISIIQGGNDTVSGTLDWSVAFLAQHPEIQERALMEIRETFGTDDILGPASEDGKLPYLCALARECLRYFTVLRLALPRYTTQEIAYSNRRIRKGSTVRISSVKHQLRPSLIITLSRSGSTRGLATWTLTSGLMPLFSDPNDGSSSLMRLSSHTDWATGCAQGITWRTEK